eukprot:7657457-Lingulodinium_polyedra.AAC.1
MEGDPPVDEQPARVLEEPARAVRARLTPVPEDEEMGDDAPTPAQAPSQTEPITVGVPRGATALPTSSAGPSRQ